jgi:hypothetical protein
MSDSANDNPPPEHDPEIEALLDFEPVPRQRVVAGAWTAEPQREFIARLAVTGSCGRASEEMGKTDTGVRKLYRSPEGASFRVAWDGAVELAKRRKSEGAVTEEAVVPGSRPPTLDHRRKHDPSPQPSPQPLSREGGEGLADPQDERKWQLIAQLGARFLKKVAAEREARTRGEIVAADFYLRQISFIEVLIDMSASKFGWDAQEMLRALRRGGRARSRSSRRRWPTGSTRRAARCGARRMRPSGPSKHRLANSRWPGLIRALPQGSGMFSPPDLVVPFREGTLQAIPQHAAGKSYVRWSFFTHPQRSNKRLLWD